MNFMAIFKKVLLSEQNVSSFYFPSATFALFDCSFHSKKEGMSTCESNFANLFLCFLLIMDLQERNKIRTSKKYYGCLSISYMEGLDFIQVRIMT